MRASPPTPAAGSKPHPELPPVAVVQLQDVAVHGAVGEGRRPPGQRDAVVPGAALLQLQQGHGRHWEGKGGLQCGPAPPQRKGHHCGDQLRAHPTPEARPQRITPAACMHSPRAS